MDSTRDFLLLHYYCALQSTVLRPPAESVFQAEKNTEMLRLPGLGYTNPAEGAYSAPKTPS